MKRLIAVIGVAFLATVSQAQIGQQFLNFAFTNSAIDVEGFRGLSENKYILAFTYAKDITTNAGVLITYDRAFTPHNSFEAESDQLNGGFTLKTTIYPLKKWSPDSTFKLEVGGYEEAGVITSGQNNGNPVNVVGGYVDYINGSFEVGILYQNRTEDDFYKGNYVGAHVGWRF